MYAELTPKVIMGDSELAVQPEWLRRMGVGSVIYCSDSDTIEKNVPIEFEYVDFPIPNHELMEDELQKLKTRLLGYRTEVLMQVNGSSKKTFICCPHGINGAPALVSVCFTDIPAEKIVAAYRRVVPRGNDTIGPIETTVPSRSHESIVVKTSVAGRGPDWSRARCHDSKTVD